MAFIVIDGYNVIGVMHGDLDAERQRLIEALAEYAKAKGHDITVVFDGWKDGRTEEGRMVTGGVSVIYSALGEKADSVIKRIVSGKGKHWIVVSSDREIISHAWAEDSVPVKSEEFMKALEGQAEERPAKQGKLSKKEKAVMRALGKL